MEGLEGAAVGHEVGGGGVAEGAEALDEPDHEIDEGLVGAAEMQAFGLPFKGALMEDAAQVDGFERGELGEGGGQVLLEVLDPHGAESGEDAENGVGLLGRVGATGKRHLNRGAAEAADGTDFEPHIARTGA